MSLDMAQTQVTVTEHKHGPEELTDIRGQGQHWEELPHIQGAVAARVQEGLEELLHVQGQEGRW